MIQGQKKKESGHGHPVRLVRGTLACTGEEQHLAKCFAGAIFGQETTKCV